MATLVEDLLTLARLDEGRPLDIADIDLVKLADNAVFDLQALDPTRTVGLTGINGRTPPMTLIVPADRDRISQVFTNLIGNIVRYTPDGSPVEIALGRSGDTAIVELRDHGPGIDETDRGRVFERFYRADTSRNRRSGGSGLGLAIVDAETGAVKVGNSETPFHEAKGTVSAGMITAVDGYTVLKVNDVLKRQTEVFALSVPATADPNDGHYKSEDGSTAYLAKSRYSYDEAADTLTDTESGTVYTADGKVGAFVASDGTQLDPGWRVFVGFDNYANMFARGDLAGPFLKALLWSFIFAAGSVLSTFALGLILGLVFADKRIKGRKIYQSLMILPYAFPAFLATLVWKGMLNTDFGFINNVLLGGAKVPWLTDGLLAKFSILGVNLWLGFPYMFLVCLGALQSLPGDVEEAAKIDGASGLRTVWSIKLPLVLQSTVPLLIASFAFNFNNFSLIYMLTGGGPNYPGMDVGQTDILISMVYKIAIESGSPNYGLASAMSIVIFIVVGVIAWLGFRQTKTREEL